jgi:hypothetical protein
MAGLLSGEKMSNTREAKLRRLPHSCAERPWCSAIACAIVTMLVLSAAVAPGISAPQQSVDRSAQVMRADRFIDSIGVNIHMQYLDGPYGDVGKVMELFRFLGVRHARDVVPEGARGIVRRMAYDGIRFNLFVSGDWRKAGTLEYIRHLEANVPNSVASIEGYNEINNWQQTFDGRSGAAAAVAAQKSLYAAIKTHPELKHIPVIDLTGFEMIKEPGFEYGRSLDGLADVMNVHAYAQNGFQPGPWIRDGIPEHYGAANRNLPKTLTEFGYASAPESGWLMIGVDERSQAKGIVNGLFGAALAGYHRTYLYELLDQKPDPELKEREFHFGLFTNASKPKLVARAIRNIVTVLKSEAGVETPVVPIEGISYEEAAKPEERIPVRSLQISRPNGALIVAAWRETLFWDRATGRPLEAPPVKAEISFGKACGSILRYDILNSSEPEPLPPGRSAAVPIGDYVQLIECAP